MSQSASVKTLSRSKVLAGGRMTVFLDATGVKSLSASTSVSFSELRLKILAASKTSLSKESALLKPSSAISWGSVTSKSDLSLLPSGSSGPASSSSANRHPHQKFPSHCRHHLPSLTCAYCQKWSMTYLAIWWLVSFLEVVPSIKVCKLQIVNGNIDIYSHWDHACTNYGFGLS